MARPKTTVTLRICGDGLAPDRVSRLLGCDPSEAYAKGDRMPTGVREAHAPTGVWMLQSDIENDADEAISDLLDRVSAEPRNWKDLSSEYQVELSFGVFFEVNAGFTISDQVLRRFADRGISLSFDLYAVQ